jgi:CheY-like chemotaxis protein
MSRTTRESVVAGGLGPCARLQPPYEVPEACEGGDAITCVLVWTRLLRVLVADDNRDAADTLSVLVKLWGHDVRAAYDGAAALELVSAYGPDVLLLDIAMPRIDGCRLAQHLRRQSRFQDTLLVAVTGYADEAHQLLCEEAGFDHYLIKPVEPSAVQRLLLLQRDRLVMSPETLHAAPRQDGVPDVENNRKGCTRVAQRPQNTSGGRGVTIPLSDRE